MSTEDEIHRACGELRRLVGLSEDVPPDVLLAVFGDAESRRRLSERPRSAAELRAFFGPEAADRPVAPDLVTGALGAFWRWARDGFGVVDPAVHARRLEACATCEHHVPPPPTLLYALGKKVVGSDSKICRLCGCFVSKKARLARETCPASAWDE